MQELYSTKLYQKLKRKMCSLLMFYFFTALIYLTLVITVWNINKASWLYLLLNIGLTISFCWLSIGFFDLKYNQVCSYLNIYFNALNLPRETFLCEVQEILTEDYTKDKISFYRLIVKCTINTHEQVRVILVEKNIRLLNWLGKSMLIQIQNGILVSYQGKHSHEYQNN